MTQNNIDESDMDIYTRECKYSLVMAVVLRAKQLNRLARERNLSAREVSYSDLDASKCIPLALDEIRTDKVNIVIRKKKTFQLEPEPDMDKDPEKLLNPQAVFPAAKGSDSSSQVKAVEEDPASAVGKTKLPGLPDSGMV